nr:MAG TPA: hypothetical protein [Caudoviricetes sp.]
MPCKPRRRPNAPVPRCGYRGAGAGPSTRLTGRPEGAPGRGARARRVGGGHRVEALPAADPAGRATECRGAPEQVRDPGRNLGT